MADLVKKRGRICVIGLTGNKDVTLPWDKFAFKAADVAFCMSTFYTSWDRAIDLIHRGLIRSEKLITHREPLDNWEQVFNDIVDLKALKALLIP
jgi:L-iditol 2-dehydrogenase